MLHKPASLLRPSLNVALPFSEKYSANFQEMDTTSSNLGGLARSVAKLMRFRRKATGVVAGISPEDSHSIQKLKFPEYLDASTIFSHSEVNEEEDGKKKSHVMSREAMESLLATLFARISAVKAAYAQLQVAQSPYDPETIQVADHQVVSELKQISQLKHSYHKNQFLGSEGVCALEIQEQKNLIKTFKITTHKLELDLEEKTRELMSLRAQLQEAENENRSLEMQIKNSKTELSVLDELHLTGLDPTHFLTVLRHTVKSIRSFVKLMVTQMEASGWDVTVAASSIEKDVLPLPEHRVLAFESYVCRKMFSDFQDRTFGMSTNSSSNHPSLDRRRFFEEFTKLKRFGPKQLLDRGNVEEALPFGKFCRWKYQQLVHPKMETCLFGNADQRSLVCSGERAPETAFFVSFSEMARRVWLLHKLFFSFEQCAQASIFRASRGCRFSEVYMEIVGLTEEKSSPAKLTVGFTVVPGFKVGKTVIQCKVYLAGTE